MKNKQKDALLEYSKGPVPLMQERLTNICNFFISSNEDDCLSLKRDNRRFLNFLNTANSKKRFKING